MPGNYRYEEERGRGRGGSRRGGFGERGRDDDMELEERERYGPSYGREQGTGRFQSAGQEGSWRRFDEGRDDDRSSGGRQGYDGYEDEEDGFGPYTGGASGGSTRYAGGYNQGRYGPGGYGSGGFDQGGYGQGGRSQGQYSQGAYNPSAYGRSSFIQGGYGEGYGLSRYGQSGYEQSGYGQGMRDRSLSSRGQRGQRSGSQADGWTGEPEEMRWGRNQGLYGSSEYGGYIASQRSQRDFQSHVGKGPKGWQRSDERIREEVSEALARHPEIDASDIEVKVQSGEVTLTGTVTGRDAKRTAEDVVERVFGVKDVQNQIKVKPEGASDREVTRSAERDTRTGSEAPETSSRRAGATAGATTR